jgi:hypothetical protein
MPVIPVKVREPKIGEYQPSLGKKQALTPNNDSKKGLEVWLKH